MIEAASTSRHASQSLHATRSAAVMPDYEYRQTVVTLPAPVGESAAAEFRAVWRIPLRLGWKADYQAVDPVKSMAFIPVRRHSALATKALQT
jgi:hypothetical protein